MSTFTISFFLSCFFTLFVFFVRFGIGYPICKNDELNCLFIATQLDQGVFWPVSGPAFVFVLSEVSRKLNMSYASVMPWLGLSGSFALTGGLSWGYCKLGIIRPWMVFSTLMLSSYFWAPLLEARPQQWGQLFVFLGSISTWLWLQQRRGGWTLLPIMVCLGFTHILSHAILLCICVALVFFDLVVKRVGTYRHFMVVLFAASSTGIYLWPAGPYAAMLADLSQVHLSGLSLIHTVLFAVSLVLMGTASAYFLRRWRDCFAEVVTEFWKKYYCLIVCFLVFLLVLLIFIQAYLLPAQAWLFYRNSWILFFIFQTGNVIFAGLFLVGLHNFFDGIRRRRFDPVMGYFIICIVMCFSVLSIVSVIFSFWLHDTNWFLRLINYGILFAAVIAAIGLDVINKKANICLGLAWGFCVFVSLTSVVRPQYLLGC